MSKVMETNKTVVYYGFSRDFIGKHWIKTGTFLGYGREVEIECDTPERRELLVGLGWHDPQPHSLYAHMNIICEYRHYHSRSNFYEPSQHDEFDHELTIDEIWEQIARMVDEKRAMETNQVVSVPA